MKFTRILWVLALSLVCATTFAAAPMQQAPQEEPVAVLDGEDIVQTPELGSDISEIRVRRTACFGVCPEDETALRADGTAQYDGKRFTEKTGMFVGRIDTDDWQKLATLFAGQFFGLEDRYAVGATDLPSIVTMAVQDGKEKTVTDYGDVEPPQLWGIEMAVRGVASQIKWKKVAMKGKSGVWGNAVLSMMGGAAPPAGMRVRPSLSPMQNAPVVVETPAGKEVARTTTDADGDFELALAPGNYMLVAGGDEGKAAGPIMQSHQPFQVEADKWTQAKVSVTVALP